MMNMMNTTGMTGLGLPLFWLHTHFVFGTVAIIGGILFTVWALKNVQGAALKSLAIWVAAIGVVGTLITASLGATAWSWMMSGKHGGGMQECPMHEQMMQQMMGHGEEEGSTHEEHQKMQEMMQKIMNQ
jgi:hypothetical protein